MNNLYTCAEIASRYKVKVITVYHWIKTGKLAAVKIGKAFRVTEAALIDFEKAAAKEG